MRRAAALLCAALLLAAAQPAAQQPPASLGLVPPRLSFIAPPYGNTRDPIPGTFELNDVATEEGLTMADVEACLYAQHPHTYEWILRATTSVRDDGSFVFRRWSQAAEDESAMALAVWVVRRDDVARTPLPPVLPMSQRDEVLLNAALAQLTLPRGAGALAPMDQAPMDTAPMDEARRVQGDVLDPTVQALLHQQEQHQHQTDALPEDAMPPPRTPVELGPVELEAQAGGGMEPHGAVPPPMQYKREAQALVAEPASPGLTMPALGLDGPITGSLGPAAGAVRARAWVYMRMADGTLYGPKPTSSTSFTIAPNGAVAISGWSTGPADLTSPGCSVYALLPGEAPPLLVGVRAPDSLLRTSVGMGYSFPRTGQQQPQPPAEPSPSASRTRAPPPAPPAGGGGGTTVGPSLRMPGVGSTAAISGNAGPGAWGGSVTARAYLYVRVGGLWYGPKPATNSFAPVATDGGFSFSGWASAPADVTADAAAAYIVGPGVTPLPVLGTATLPPTSAALSWVQVSRDGTVLGSSATTTTSPVNVPTAPPGTGPIVPPAPPPGSPGELPWPPVADPGPRANNGRSLNIGGYDCIIKDTGGGSWGPGPNVFVGNTDFIWTDNYGLHLNVRPRNGCDNFASSECFFSKPLGYGNYLFRMVGPLEHQDFQVTYGLFTWDDNAASVWYRELDFEVGRWGNPGDVNVMQYVVQPWTRPNNLKRTSFRAARSFDGQGGPDGSGQCNDPNPQSFNGAITNRVTCIMQWFNRQVRWYCFDGLWTMAAIRAGAARDRLLSSLEYFDPASVFTPGDERVHLNLWQANSGRPGWGRRVHQIIAGFEFDAGSLDMPQAGYPINRMLLGSGMMAENLRIDSLFASMKEALGLSRQEQRALSAILHRQLAAAVEAGEVDASKLTDAALQDQRVVQWLEAFPALLTGGELLPAAAARRAKATGPTRVRRLLSKTFARLLGQAPPAEDEEAALADDPYASAMRSLQGSSDSAVSYSCGDPRGMNNIEFWYPTVAAQYTDSFAAAMAQAPAAYLDEAAQVYGSTFHTVTNAVKSANQLSYGSAYRERMLQAGSLQDQGGSGSLSLLFDAEHQKPSQQAAGSTGAVASILPSAHLFEQNPYGPAKDMGGMPGTRLGPEAGGAAGIVGDAVGGAAGMERMAAYVAAARRAAALSTGAAYQGATGWLPADEAVSGATAPSAPRTQSNTTVLMGLLGSLVALTTLVVAGVVAATKLRRQSTEAPVESDALLQRRSGVVPRPSTSARGRSPIGIRREEGSPGRDAPASRAAVASGTQHTRRRSAEK